ncbi:MAG: type II 3-dehydroquinate dehydratase [Bacteroidales bacterium]|jgi:3-dehydroquinate dehydratase-2|nr:type II 3-dehydroquinate dehydratase [Bacteroidales bacterium]
MKHIVIINGVNLGELGSREVNIYGHTDFDSYMKQLQIMFSNVKFSYYQTDSLEEIVAALLQNRDKDGIVLNPGAYTHTAMVLADTIKAIPARVVEVHISNLFGRENFRKTSYIAAACAGSISGFGLKGYQLAVLSLLN